MNMSGMNMKKRSQSSLRAKTLQSQDDHSEVNYWIGNLHAKKMLNKAGQKIASSMIECNKQNTQVNISYNTPVYQSVNQQITHSVNHTPVGKHKTSENLSESRLVTALQQRCKKLQKQLSVLYNNQNIPGQLHMTPNSHPTRNTNANTHGPYTYVDKYYQIEIEGLRGQINEMNTQLKKYRQLYSSKKEELDDLNQGISERIEKQYNEKNVLIKEINTNNIEIKRLREEVNLHKSEKEALKMVLREKQTNIEQLNSSIAQVEIKKKKVEGYEMQLRESQATLKEIQLQMGKLKGEAEKKDAIIASSNKKISGLQSKLLQYQQDIKQLQKCVICLKESSSQSSMKIRQAYEECQQWKNKYCEVKQQIEQIPELHIKLKNTQLTIEDLQIRTKQLISTNQKLKVDLGNYQSLKTRVSQQEKEIINLKKLLRQKCEQLEIIQNSHLINHGLQQQMQHYKSKITVLERQYQQKQQQLRLTKARVEEKQHKINQLYEELEQTEKERIRIKQLQYKIDTLFTQNQKLHTSLLQKVAQIQELQRKLNTLESKNVSLANECTKVRAMYDSMAEQLTESHSKLQNMQNRWETQLGAKIGLQQKCTRFSKQIVTLRGQIALLEQNNRNLTEKSEQIMVQFEQTKQQLCLQLQQLNAYKQQAEAQLHTSYGKMQEFKEVTKQLRGEIESQLEQQKEYIMKTRNMQSYIISLQSELSSSKNQLQKLKSHWTLVQETASAALFSYK